MRAERKLWYSGLVASYGRRRPVCQTRNDLLCRVICLAIVGNTAKLWILVFRRVDARQSWTAERRRCLHLAHPTSQGPRRDPWYPVPNHLIRVTTSARLRAFLRLEISFIPRTSFCYVSVYSSGNRARLAGLIISCKHVQTRINLLFYKYSWCIPGVESRILNFQSITCKYSISWP